MIKTVREIHSLSLPGFPQTEFRVRERIIREGWEVAGKRGKALLYKVPLDLQPLIIKSEAGEDLSSLHHPAAEGLHTKTDQQSAAKILIVEIFSRYMRENKLPVIAAAKGFAALYKAGAQHLFPAWLREIYPAISWKSLLRWRGCARHEKRGRRRGQSTLMRANDGEVSRFIAAMLVTNAHLTAGHLRDRCRAQFGETLDVCGRKKPMPDIRTFERHRRQWIEQNSDTYLKLTDPAGHKNRYQMAIGRANAGIERMNQLWEIDASPADALLVDGRYTVYAIIDVWSRRAMFSVSKTATSGAALALLRRAVLEWGVPEALKTDNGSDFKSHRFFQFLRDMEVYRPPVAPHSPEKKPFVERVIRELQRQLIATLPGFVGHNVADRKKIEEKKTLAQRLGVSDAETFKVSLNADGLQAAIDHWVEYKYMQTAHRGIEGKTPLQMVISSPVKPRMVEDVRALDMLLSPIAEGNEGFRNITKKGIRVAGIQYVGSGMELYVGKRVLVRHDPSDLGRVFLFNEENRFLCEAVNFALLGQEQQMSIAIGMRQNQKNNMKDAVAPIKKLMRRATPQNVHADLASIWKRDGDTLKAFPKQTETYTTPSLDEAARAGRKEQVTLDRTAERKALQEAIVKDFAEYQSQPTPLTDEERWWNNAKEMEARIAAGETLTPAEQNRLAHAKTTSWYRAMTEHERRKKELYEGA